MAPLGAGAPRIRHSSLLPIGFRKKKPGEESLEMPHASYQGLSPTACQRWPPQPSPVAATCSSSDEATTLDTQTVWLDGSLRVLVWGDQADPLASSVPARCSSIWRARSSFRFCAAASARAFAAAAASPTTACTSLCGARYPSSPGFSPAAPDLCPGCVGGGAGPSVAGGAEETIRRGQPWRARAHPPSP